MRRDWVVYLSIGSRWFWYGAVQADCADAAVQSAIASVTADDPRLARFGREKFSVPYLAAV